MRRVEEAALIGVADVKKRSKLKTSVAHIIVSFFIPETLANGHEKMIKKAMDEIAFRRLSFCMRSGSLLLQIRTVEFAS